MEKRYVTLVPLDKIRANPYQVRDGENPVHVEDIAASIRSVGLLQPGMGRVNFSNIGAAAILMMRSQPLEYQLEHGCYVELAYGHTRLAALKLNQAEHAGDGFMPLALHDLMDVQLFELAVSENVLRKDLSPIEQGRAMLVYRDQFGKTSEEIGALFGLSDSTVRNKIRLLDLPEDVRLALDEGKITEGMGREILALKALPADILKKAEEKWESSWDADRGDYSKPSTIIQKTLEGKVTLDQMGNLLNKIITSHSVPMSQAPWKWEQVEEGEEIANPTCKDCPLKFNKGSSSFCMKKTCYQERQKRFEQRYLEKASQACGLPPLEAGREYYTDFYSWPERDYFEPIRERGCSNLRIQYQQSNEHNKNVQVPHHPHAEIVCLKRKGACTCVQGLKIKGTEQPTPPPPSPQPAAAEGEFDDSVSIETVTPTPLPASLQAASFTSFRASSGERSQEPLGASARGEPFLGEAELKELARATRRQRQQNKNEVRAMLEMATDRIRAGLEANNTSVWRRIAYRFQNSLDHKLRDLSEFHLKLIIAKGIAARDGYDPEESYSKLAEEDPEKCLDRYNELLEKLGLEKIPNNLPKDSRTEVMADQQAPIDITAVDPSNNLGASLPLSWEGGE